MPKGSQHQLQWIFENAFEFLNERSRCCAINASMINGQRNGHNRRNGQCAIFDDRTLLPGTDRQNAALW
jgi:hypothetical protein